MNVLGIDVGMNGCVAFYDGKELLLLDMPTFDRNKTRRVDCLKLYTELNAMLPVDHAYIEQVNAFGMGVSSAYNFGWSCGVVEAVVASLHIPFTYVTPMKWKAALGVPKDKDAARMRASQLLPDHAHNWTRKKDSDRAEASLIALYGLRAQANTL